MNRLDLRLPRRREFPCPRCKADLRGQSLYANCPSCGASIHAIFIEARRDSPHGYQMGALRIQKPWFRAIAHAIGYPRSAIEYVADAIAFAPARWFGKTNAKDICHGFGVVARKSFRDAAEAREMLIHWKLARSEDVGGLTMALLDHGLARADGVKSADDFAGLFVTERWFS
ncbi:MAG: hypothetical protein QM770_11390 [Tepidisphaeraceae bacterium]